VNTVTSGNQSGSAITALADGGWIVTWESVQDGDSYGIYQQRYDTAGIRIGVETRVNTTTASHQTESAVTSLADGGWLVTWNSYAQDGSLSGVYQQHYDSDGSKIGVETRVNTTTADDQFGKSVVGLADGGWVATWQSVGQDGSQSGVYQQRYRADGTTVASEVRVNTTTLHSQIASTTAALADGGWVTTWTSYDQDGDATGIYQQRYAAYGGKVGVETQVNTESAGNQIYSSVAALSDGGWVVTWGSNGQDGDSGGVYQQRYESTGEKAGVETLVNTTTQDGQGDSSVSGLADGGWMVAWVSSGQDGDGEGVYQQRYDVGGVRVGGETRISATTAGNQTDPSVVALADGGWEVTWTSSVGAVTDIHQRHFATDVAGTALGETLVGTGWGETLIGYGGNDRLEGAGGEDIMIGGFGNDTYVVDSLTDTIQELVGQGADTVLASLDYSLSILGNLGSIENLTLSGTGDLNGTGNALANVIAGNSGSNILDGVGGADTMKGGLGNDSYYVDNAGDQVVEISGQGTDIVYSSIDFNLTGQYIENLTLAGTALKATGNSLANVLVGNAGNNLLDGMSAADTMRGGMGDDSYYVDNAGDQVTELSDQGIDIVYSSVDFSLAGQHIDNLTLTGTALKATGNSLANVLIGNAGNNLLDGMGAADVMTGGSGSDTFVFSTKLVAGNVDTITDFSVAADTIRLSQAIFSTIVGTGILSAAQFVANASGAAEDANDRIIYQTGTGKLFYDSNGSAAGGATQFATISSGLSLTSTNFSVL